MGMPAVIRPSCQEPECIEARANSECDEALKLGREEGEKAAEARIVAWLKDLPCGDYSALGLAWRIEKGEHRG